MPPALSGDHALMSTSSTTHVLSAFFPFCGLGAGARGFLQAAARFGKDEARFVNLGGVDMDPLACKDFEYLTGAEALCAGLNAVTPEELRFFVVVRPDVIFSSSAKGSDSCRLVGGVRGGTYAT